MTVPVEVLKRFDTLRNLPDALLLRLSEQSLLKKYARREVVIDPGADTPYLCFLFEGCLQGVDFTVDGREVGLYFVRAGDFCGEVGLFGLQPNPEFVISLVKSVVLQVPYAVVEPIMYDSREIMKGLNQRLAQRVFEFARQRSILSLNSIPKRIYHLLLQLAGIDGFAEGGAHAYALSSGGEEVSIPSPPTHQEMAIMLNTSRETVTRVFQSLQAGGVVQRNGTSSLVILQPEVLCTMALSDEG